MTLDHAIVAVGCLGAMLWGIVFVLRGDLGSFLLCGFAARLWLEWPTTS